MFASKLALPSKAAWLAAALAATAAAACNAPEPCGSPGLVLMCSCGATKGARVCSAQKTWGACDCSGAILLPRANPPGAPDSGTRASSGTGGSGNSSSSGGGVRPTATGGAPAPSSEDDAGSLAQGGTGGHGGSGGTGGKGSPDAGPTQPMPSAYGACMAASDCQTGAQCVMTPSFPNNASVCAPACVDVGQCPKPEGSYEATLACDTGLCRLDCTPVLFAPLLTCPSGMTCVAPLFGTAYCHAGP